MKSKSRSRYNYHARLMRLSLVSFLTLCSVCYAQNVPVLYPTLLPVEQIKPSERSIWERALELYDSRNGHLTIAKMDTSSLIYKFYMAIEDSIVSPSTLSSGCSWYCGGMIDTIYASSYIDSNGKISYDANAIHDFNRMTAWIPDAKGENSVGERISFVFPQQCPRITNVQIWNGYQKDSQIWKANGRVSKLKMYINDSIWAVLELKDEPGMHDFNIGLIGSSEGRERYENRGPIFDTKASSPLPMTITFEIAGVYQGYKYDDVAITEINFNGIDVH